MAAHSKPHVSVSVEQVINYVETHGIVNVLQIAEAFDIHPGTARRKLDAGVWRGELLQDKYDTQGARLHFELYRYCANDA